METIYSNKLKMKLSLVDEAFYNKALVYACAFWVIRVINCHVDEVMKHDIICPSGPVDHDSRWEPEKNAFRPKILFWIEAFIFIAKKVNYLSALSRKASELSKVQWPGTTFMDYYPVFMNKGAK
ncbi:MAG TPA: hypothetical protein VFP93_00595 [Gammaproteobacteria bacterium]|nr:hypothetical protein [Gammaproteobacteria bacterium]